MTVISPITLHPERVGELYTDRNLKILGEARWNSAAQTLQTKSFKVVITPTNGGAVAETTLPDNTYALSSVGSSLWMKIRRTAGTTTALVGDIQIYTTNQPKPLQDWVMLFYRSATDEVITVGGHLILPGPMYTKVGISRAYALYDAIVGPSTNPFVTHTSIESAISDITSGTIPGTRILVLEGTYTINAATNPAVSGTAMLAWENKTITIEGEGYNTVIQKTSGGLTEAFAIRSTTGTSGSGCKISNLRITGLNRTVAFLSTGGQVNNSVFDVWIVPPSVWTISTIVTGSNNHVVERVEDLAAGTFRLEVTNLQSTGTEGTTIRHETLQEFQNKVRVGNTANQGRLKLPAYTTANRTAATGLEQGEIFWDTTTQTLEVRQASTWASFAPIPVGAYIFMGGTFSLANNGGTYQAATSVVTVPANYAVCTGTSAISSLSVFSGRFTPKINDDRFLRAVATDTGTVSGVDTVNVDHTHTYSHSHAIPHTHTLPAHTHPMPHTHTVPNHSHTYAHSHYHDHTHTMPSSQMAHVHVWSRKLIWNLGPPANERTYPGLTSSSPNTSTTTPTTNPFFAEEIADPGLGYGMQTLPNYHSDGPAVTHFTTGKVNASSGSTGLTNDPGDTGTSSPGTTSALPAAQSTGASSATDTGPAGSLSSGASSAANSGVSAPTSTATNAPSLASVSVIPRYISCSVYLRVY